jgi:hypothetical protein
MAKHPRPLLLAGCALVWLTASCGRSEELDSDVMSLSHQLATEMASDPSVLNDVNLTDRSGFSTTVTPSYLPKAGQTARDLQIIFYPKLTVKNTKFVYDKAKWTVAVGNNVQFLTGADIIEIKEDGNFSSGETREGQIKMTVRLTTQGQWPDKVTSDSALTTISGRKALKLLPYYSLDGAVAPGNSGTLQGVSAAYMKDDVGAIVAPASLGGVAVTDGAFSVDFTAPQDTTADDTSSGSVASVGQSNISGFVVVYWNDAECRAGGWTFKPNKVFDKNKSNADLTCSYPGLETAAAGENSCQLGCSTETSSDFFGKSANDIAVPPEFPSDVGTINRIKRGCLNIVRVAADGRTSYAVNDVVNGESYGIMVYPLDSSGGIGMMRSRCEKALPFNVEFPSARKTPGLRKTKSDCFVATAAAGSSQSAAVHYWRILRDAWLDRWGVSSFYYKHGPAWAAWLDENPRLKPAVNAALEWSGKTLVRMSQWMQHMTTQLQQTMQKVSLSAIELLASEAQASEAPAPQTTDNGKGPKAGSASTTLTLAGGQIRPSSDKEYYDLAYKDKKPAFAFVGQSFRLFDLSGEIGLGYEFTGLLLKGTSSDSTQTPITLSGLGGGILGEYRLRIGTQPWLSPRVSAVFGKMRMREEAAAIAASNTTSGSSSSSSSSSAGTGSGISPSGTEPVWHNYKTFRFFLDVSIPRLYGDDENLIRYGYEAEDMTLSLFAGMNTNEGKVISTSGLQLGGGISFMFR